LANNLVMAPMAGYTDWPFRKILGRFRCSLVVTEMIAAKPLAFGHGKTLRMLYNDRKHCALPAGIQIVGSDIPSLVKAAQKAQELEYDLIDLNAGCPAHKMIKSGAGSSLVRETFRLHKILAAMRKEIRIPFTLKMRIGWDENSINAAETAKIAEGEGVDAIFVHGRTRAAGYAGKVNLDGIRAVKQTVKIPVFGNGDVRDVASALNMFEKTGCDGLMIGRYAVEDPAIFDRIDAALAGRPVPPPPTLREKALLLRDICRELFAFYGDNIGSLRSRGALLFSMRGFPNASQMRKQITQLKGPAAFERFFDGLLAP
ncbi:MAG TPA: tRNA dihydrouridine synthase DusB, partial [bacterium]|nr:tRNA dihydrouridine synthase DusB [bacterium]